MFSQVVMTEAAHRALAAAVQAVGPRELVAVLGGARDQQLARVDRVLTLPNQSPWPDAFVVDAVAFAGREQQLRQAGRQWLGFAHSHPHGSAVPSLRDRRQLWRNCLQLIAAPAFEGDEPTVRAFWLRDDLAAPPPADAVVTAIPLAIEALR